MSSPEVEAAWKEEYDRQKSRLTKRARQKLAADASLSSLRNTVEDLNVKRSSARVHRCTKKLGPVINWLDSFTKAINTLVSSHPEYAGLIWGTIQGIMITFNRYSSVMEMVTNNLRDMNKTLSRCHAYLEMFPGRTELNAPLRHLYGDYVGFLIDSLNFLIHNGFWNVLRMLWSRTHHRFSTTMESINQHLDEYDRIARLMIDQFNMSSQKNLNHVIPTLSAAPPLPDSDINIRLPRNPYFTGRDKELGQLKEAMTSKDALKSGEVCTCIISGPGGIGKTGLAAECAHRMKSYYHYIYWLSSGKVELLANDFAQIARNLHLAPPGAAIPQETVAAKNWLSKTDRNWLLIFDNLEEAGDVLPYLPANQKGSIIITTQKQSISLIGWESSVTHVPLKPLSLSEGSGLLMSHAKAAENVRDITALLAEEKQAQDISEEVGGYPLGLTHVAGIVIENPVQTFARVLKTLKSRKESSQLWAEKKPQAVWQYEKSLQDVNEVALEELDANCRRILDILACFDSAGVQEDILLSDSSDGIIDALGLQCTEAKQTSMIGDLTKRQLVTVQRDQSGQLFVIHRMLQRELLQGLDGDLLKREVVFAKALALIRRKLPHLSQLHVPKREEWKPYKKYLSHVLSLKSMYDQSDPAIQGSEELAVLFNHAGNLIWERGLALSGISCLKTAEKVLNSISYNETAPLRADIYVMTGVLSSRIGLSLRDQELEYRRKALKLREINADHNSISQPTAAAIHYKYNARNDLAIGLLQIEKFHEASLLLEDCLKWYEAVFTEEENPFEYAKYYHNYSFVHLSHGKVDLAKNFAERGKDLRGRGSGPKNPLALIYRFTHACCVYRCGDISLALQLHDAILKDRNEVLGEHDWWTLGSCFMVGLLHFEMGNLSNAEEFLESIVRNASAASLPQEHLARVKYRLSQILELHRDEAKRGRATTLRKEAETMLEEFLPLFPCDVKTAGLDPAVLYDYLVPMFQGRTAGYLSTCKI